MVVAGGGIAGLSAGLTAARLGRRTLILTGGILGGQLLSIAKVDGYPGFPDGVPGYDLCPMAQEMAAAAGAEIDAAELTRLAPGNDGFRIATDDGGEFAARGVVIATGARLKELGVPGEAEFRGKGVSHCATCDGPLLKGRIAAVVGGGDSAAQEALTLVDYDARVVMFLRGAELSAQAAYRDKVLAHPRIELRPNTAVTEIRGAQSVTGVRISEAGGADARNRGGGRLRLYRARAQQRRHRRSCRARCGGARGGGPDDAELAPGSCRGGRGARRMAGPRGCVGRRRRQRGACDRALSEGRCVA